MSLQSTNAAKGGGGGFCVGKGLQMRHSSLHIIDSWAERRGGGFLSLGHVVIWNSLLSIEDVRADAGGAFCAPSLSLETSNLTAPRSLSQGWGKMPGA